jgi:capsular polysaccharide biosynthesis protein
MQDDLDPMIRDVLRLMRRGLVLALVLGVLAGVAGFFVSRALPPLYEAEATLVVAALDPTQRDFGVTLVTAPALDVTTYIAAIRSRDVLVDALRSLDGASPSMEELEAVDRVLEVRAVDARVSSLVRISVRDRGASRASDLANAVAAAAVRWDAARATRALAVIVESLAAQIAAIEAELPASTDGALTDGLTRNRADLQLQLSSARALSAAAVGRLEVLERAAPPSSPVAPRPVRNAVVAALFAVLVVYATVFMRAALDTHPRSSEDLQSLSGVPVLAEFPLVSTGRRALPREAASFLRTAVSFALSADHPKVGASTPPAAATPCPNPFSRPVRGRSGYQAPNSAGAPREWRMSPLRAPTWRTSGAVPVAPASASISSSSEVRVPLHTFITATRRALGAPRRGARRCRPRRPRR